EPEQEKRELFIVQVKGLPWSCTADDLLKFFSECRIRDGVKGIHLTVNRMGRPSGRAFIEMEHEEDVNKALEKHRQYLGPRYVEVYEVTERDAEAIIKKAAEAQADDGVVRLRGLPFTSTEADITRFFSDLDIMENGITIITDYAGRNSGDAFVPFVSPAAAARALPLARALLGGRSDQLWRQNCRFVTFAPPRCPRLLFTADRSVLTGCCVPLQIHRSVSPQKQRIRTSGFSQAGHRGTSSQRSVQSSSSPLPCIPLRGLPFPVCGEDLVRFFSPLPVSKMLIEFGPDGRPSGEADVYFTRHQDAVAAMSRDRQHIGGRYIELFLNSVPDS
uniref:RRM domain-containing protein n=1 Tax=Tetraodon nigroviridis TaxID=99883 RepID=H3C2H6_TETNG